MDGYNSHEQFLLQYYKYSKYSSILQDRDILFSVIVYVIHTFNQMSFDSLIPVIWVNTLSYGGFEMSLQEVGLFQTMASPVALVAGIILFRK